MESEITLSMSWAEIIPALRLLFVLVTGLGAVNVINFIKKLSLNWFGKKIAGSTALVLTMAISVILALGTMVVEGQLTAESINWQNIDQLVAAVLIASKLRYDMLKRKQAAEEPAADEEQK